MRRFAADSNAACSHSNSRTSLLCFDAVDVMHLQVFVQQTCVTVAAYVPGVWLARSHKLCQKYLVVVVASLVLLKQAVPLSLSCLGGSGSVARCLRPTVVFLLCCALCVDVDALVVRAASYISTTAEMTIRPSVFVSGYQFLPPMVVVMSALLLLLWWLPVSSASSHATC
jgi:hypothetical protein